MGVKLQVRKRLISWVTLICFALTQWPVSGVFAADATSAPRFSQIQIPANLGTLREFYQGSSSKTVVLIQDAHTNYDAQTSIRRLIDYFQKKFDVQRVGLEGGSGPLDLGILRAFPDRKVKEEVMEEYVRSGELSGAEMASVVNENPAEYVGLENSTLYHENKKVFLKVLSERNKFESSLREIRQSLDSVSTQIESKNLRTIRESWQKFQKQELTLLDLILMLQEKAKEAKLSLDNYPNLAKVFSLITHPDVARHPSQEGNSPLSRGVAPKEPGCVFAMTGELQSLTQALKEKLYRSGEERSLDRAYQNLGILEKFGRLEASREDFLYFQFHKNEFAPNFFETFLNKFKINLHPVYSLEKINRFYDLAFAREQAMVEHLFNSPLERGGAEGAGVCNAILITGGFHTEGMKAALKKAGVSYLLVTPKIQNVASSELYLKAMRGEFSYAQPLNLEEKIAQAGDDDFKILLRRKLQEWRMRISGLPMEMLQVLDRQLGIATLSPEIQTKDNPFHANFLFHAEFRLVERAARRDLKSKDIHTIRDLAQKIEQQLEQLKNAASLGSKAINIIYQEVTDRATSGDWDDAAEMALRELLPRYYELNTNQQAYILNLIDRYFKPQRESFDWLNRQAIESLDQRQMNLSILEPVNALAWSPDVAHLYSWSHTHNFKGSAANRLQRWDAKTGKPNWPEMIFQSPEAIPFALHPDGVHGLRIDASIDMENFILSLGAEPTTIAKSGGFLPQASAVSCAMPREGETLVIGQNDGSIRVWDLRTFKEKVKYEKIHTKGKKVHSIAVNPIDGFRVVSASENDEVKVWDLRNGSVIGKMAMYQPAFGVKSMKEAVAVTWTPDGKYPVMVSEDGTVSFRDSVTGKEVGYVKANVKDVRAAAFSPDGQYLALGTEKGSIHLMRARSKAEMAALSGTKKGRSLGAEAKLKQKLLAAPALGTRDGLGKVIRVNDLSLNDREKPILAGWIQNVDKAAFGEGPTVQEWTETLNDLNEHQILLLIDSKGEITGFFKSLKKYYERIEGGVKVILEEIAAKPDGQKGKGTFLMDVAFDELQKLSRERNIPFVAVWAAIEGSAPFHLSYLTKKRVDYQTTHLHKKFYVYLDTLGKLTEAQHEEQVRHLKQFMENRERVIRSVEGLAKEKIFVLTYERDGEPVETKNLKAARVKSGQNVLIYDGSAALWEQGSSDSKRTLVIPPSGISEKKRVVELASANSLGGISGEDLKRFARSFMDQGITSVALDRYIKDQFGTMEHPEWGRFDSTRKGEVRAFVIKDAELSTLMQDDVPAFERVLRAISVLVRAEEKRKAKEKKEIAKHTETRVEKGTRGDDGNKVIPAPVAPGTDSDLIKPVQPEGSRQIVPRKNQPADFDGVLMPEGSPISAEFDAEGNSPFFVAGNTIFFVERAANGIYLLRMKRFAPAGGYVNLKQYGKIEPGKPIRIGSRKLKITDDPNLAERHFSIKIDISGSKPRVFLWDLGAPQGTFYPRAKFQKANGHSLGLTDNDLTRLALSLKERGVKAEDVARFIQDQFGILEHPDWARVDTTRRGTVQAFVVKEKELIHLRDNDPDAYERALRAILVLMRVNEKMEKKSVPQHQRTRKEEETRRDKEGAASKKEDGSDLITPVNQKPTPPSKSVPPKPAKPAPPIAPLTQTQRPVEFDMELTKDDSPIYTEMGPLVNTEDGPASFSFAFMAGSTIFLVHKKPEGNFELWVMKPGEKGKRGFRDLNIHLKIPADKKLAFGSRSLSQKLIDPYLADLHFAIKVDTRHAKTRVYVWDLGSGKGTFYPSTPGYFKKAKAHSLGGDAERLPRGVLQSYHPQDIEEVLLLTDDSRKAVFKMRPKLIEKGKKLQVEILQNNGVIQTIEFTPGQDALIGRDIFSEDSMGESHKRLSTKHVKVGFSKDGRHLELTDLSRNGTYVRYSSHHQSSKDAETVFDKAVPKTRTAKASKTSIILRPTNKTEAPKPTLGGTLNKIRTLLLTAEYYDLNTPEALEAFQNAGELLAQITSEKLSWESLSRQSDYQQLKSKFKELGPKAKKAGGRSLGDRAKEIALLRDAIWKEGARASNVRDYLRYHEQGHLGGIQDPKGAGEVDRVFMESPVWKYPDAKAVLAKLAEDMEIEEKARGRDQLGRATYKTLEGAPIERSGVSRRINNVRIPVFIFRKNGLSASVEINPEFYDPTIPAYYIENYKAVLEEIIQKNPKLAPFLLRKKTAPKYFDYFALSDFKQFCTTFYHESDSMTEEKLRVRAHDYILDYVHVAHQFEGAAPSNLEWDKASQSLKAHRKFALQGKKVRAEYRRAFLLSQYHPFRIVSLKEATWDDWKNPEIMIVDDAAYRAPEWRKIPGQSEKDDRYPGEIALLAQWKNMFFFLYVSRSHTAETSEVHQWRSTDEFTEGIRFKKNPIAQNLEDARGQLSVMLDRAIYDPEKVRLLLPEHFNDFRMQFPLINKALQGKPADHPKFREARARAKAQSLGAGGERKLLGSLETYFPEEIDTIALGAAGTESKIPTIRLERKNSMIFWTKLSVRMIYGDVEIAHADLKPVEEVLIRKIGSTFYMDKVPPPARENTQPVLTISFDSKGEKLFTRSMNGTEITLGFSSLHRVINTWKEFFSLEMIGNSEKISSTNPKRFEFDQDTFNRLVEGSASRDRELIKKSPSFILDEIREKVKEKLKGFKQNFKNAAGNFEILKRGFGILTKPVMAKVEEHIDELGLARIAALDYAEKIFGKRDLSKSELERAEKTLKEDPAFASARIVKREEEPLPESFQKRIEPIVDALENRGLRSEELKKYLENFVPVEEEGRAKRFAAVNAALYEVFRSDPEVAGVEMTDRNLMKRFVEAILEAQTEREMALSMQKKFQSQSVPLPDPDEFIRPVRDDELRFPDHPFEFAEIVARLPVDVSNDPDFDGRLLGEPEAVHTPIPPVGFSAPFKAGRTVFAVRSQGDKFFLEMFRPDAPTERPVDLAGLNKDGKVLEVGRNSRFSEIKDPEISGRHFAVSVNIIDGRPHLFLRDLISTNGTFFSKKHYKQGKGRSLGLPSAEDFLRLDPWSWVGDDLQKKFQMHRPEVLHLAGTFDELFFKDSPKSLVQALKKMSGNPYVLLVLHIQTNPNELHHVVVFDQLSVLSEPTALGEIVTAQLDLIPLEYVFHAGVYGPNKSRIEPLLFLHRLSERSRVKSEDAFEKLSKSIFGKMYPGVEITMLTHDVNQAQWFKQHFDARLALGEEDSEKLERFSLQTMGTIRENLRVYLDPMDTENGLASLLEKFSEIGDKWGLDLGQSDISIPLIGRVPGKGRSLGLESLATRILAKGVEEKELLDWARREVHADIQPDQQSFQQFLKEVKKTEAEAGVISDKTVEEVERVKGILSLRAQRSNFQKDWRSPRRPLASSRRQDIALAIHVDSLPDELSASVIQILKQVKKLILVFPQGDEKADRIVKLLEHHVIRMPYAGNIPVRDIQRMLEREHGLAKAYLTPDLLALADHIKKTSDPISYFEFKGHFYPRVVTENVLSLVIDITENPSTVHAWPDVAHPSSLGNGFVGISFNVEMLVNRLEKTVENQKTFAHAA